ncbi:helix-turn-helix transcriptional regulator [Haloarcula brevis]|uniref:helix-turn-helix transcriptional regulator n=1 Tax=Haloarcula brevis TaxID=3111453 RepID=UPI00300F64B3
MTPRVSGALLLLVLVALVATPPLATAAATDPVVAQQTTGTPAPVAENTTFALAIQSNGDARWTITDTYALEENETEAFRDTGEQFAAEDDQAVWLPAFREARAEASTVTGREMSITGVDRRYEVSDRKGQLILEFTWTNFATVDGENIVVGDAFNATDGTWFGTLTADQRLVISPPPGYGVESAPSAVTDGKLVFEGQRTFEPGYLSVVYTGEQPNTQTPTDTPGSAFGGVDSVWLGGVVLLVLLVGAVGYMFRTGYADGLPSATADDDGGDSAGTAAPTSDTTDSEEVDVELLSDEERVERLLEENGGRMKQARIVSETGWSNAKVSQLLSSMDEEGRIDKLRIGRENLISFPDEDITDFDE